MSVHSEKSKSGTGLNLFFLQFMLPGKYKNLKLAGHAPSIMVGEEGNFLFEDGQFHILNKGNIIFLLQPETRML
ncbi:MAG: hypothetical protein Ct9H300mP21_10940 [Pseudomonadota bacterium]|nr:MAG: hypothetical protein Ct9H300mP21_10940 [Pseudomonadota bacterium]